MPVVGEIAAFAFDNDKARPVELLRSQGWIACEGQSVTQVAGPNGLPNLFAVIGSSWGSADKNVFNVPDLRGQFLRGWNHEKGADPDAKGRGQLKQGGVAGDNVGSAQKDEFASHNHGIRGAVGLGMLDTQEDMAPTHPESKQTRGRSDMHQGGKETRPCNVSVMYCIFTGHAPLPKEVKFFAD